MREPGKASMMSSYSKPHVLVLGGNFAGLVTARRIRERCGDAVRISLVDRKDYLLFLPNIPLEILADHDPSDTLRMPIRKILAMDDIGYIGGEVVGIDVKNSRVMYTPAESPGSATENIDYDYLVIALGARQAYDRIDGFNEHGHALSDAYYGNKLRAYLHGGYRGGPIAIGSARFHQGTAGKPEWLPLAETACEGVALEMAFSLAAWLDLRNLGGPGSITLFTPGRLIAEYFGDNVASRCLEMANQAGLNYTNNTGDIKRISRWGIEFENGRSLEAELKIILPNLEPHLFMKGLPVSDEAGFVITDSTMRNPDYKNIFAVGDCAALTVPKMGVLGDEESRIVTLQIAGEVGKASAEETGTSYTPEIVWLGEMGRNKAFYIHSDTWFGGTQSVFKVGYTFYTLKLGFREVFFRTGGNPPSWGVPLAELMAEHLL
jgi:sulfide:quinone oxidoreductase